MTTTIGVKLSRGRSYNILVGRNVLGHTGKQISELAPDCRVVVVTDAKVAALHLECVTESLSRAGIDHSVVTIPDGEKTKSFKYLEDVCLKLLDTRIERKDVIIALGGGVIGDLAGFAAGILRRGLRVVQIPTTLMAQVDSSVGGITAIDVPQGKNLIGVFNQPMLVLADTEVLSTLPQREQKAGYAEIVKYSLINDPTFFAWLEKNGSAVIHGDPEAQIHAITKSCHTKAAIVEIDEVDTSGDRALLNLGHTFAHAIEAAMGYSDKIRHGEAVSVGLVLAFDLSTRMNHCQTSDARRVRQHLADVGLPTRITDLGQPVSEAALMKLMLQDKKNERGHPVFVLARGIGKAFLSPDVPLSTVSELLKEHLDQ